MAKFCHHCGNELPIAGRQIAGVCAGLAQTYGWDLTLIRVIAILTFLCSGGIVAVGYVACWIGIPEESFPHL
ncbi:MAG TPA: PspC domain-containing protein [Terracidiphilus sp.]